MDEEDVSDYSLQTTSSKTIPLSSSSLKIIPIYSDDKKNTIFNSNCSSVQILSQSKELSDEGQLSSSSRVVTSNEVDDADELYYEDQHCYSSPSELVNEKIKIKPKLSIAPFQLIINEALSTTNLSESIPNNLLVTLKDIPNSFLPKTSKDTLIQPSSSSPTTISTLTPSEANAALSSSYEPFESNPDKQKRYKSFLISISKGNPVLISEVFI